MALDFDERAVRRAGSSLTSSRIMGTIAGTVLDRLTPVDVGERQPAAVEEPVEERRVLVWHAAARRSRAARWR